MSYSHILAAVNLDSGNDKVIAKAVGLAKLTGAKVSLIHVNKEVAEESVFGGLIDIDLAMAEPAHTTAQELSKKLDAVADNMDYAVENKFLIKGDLSHGLDGPVKETDVDLIVCGHHHNFWSRLKPAARDLVNTATVDLLIVPLDE